MRRTAWRLLQAVEDDVREDPTRYVVSSGVILVLVAAVVIRGCVG